ncbi:hypothetical protein GGX14DRAFT_625076, partial [Mycena pura]
SGFRGKLIMALSVFGYFPSNLKLMPMYDVGIVNFMRSMAQFYADKHITVS